MFKLRRLYKGFANTEVITRNVYDVCYKLFSSTYHSLTMNNNHATEFI